MPLTPADGATERPLPSVEGGILGQSDCCFRVPSYVEPRKVPRMIHLQGFLSPELGNGLCRLGSRPAPGKREGLTGALLGACCSPGPKRAGTWILAVTKRE